MTTVVDMMVALQRLTCFSSTKKATITSKREIEEVRAAMVSRRKKRIAHSCPKAIL